MAGLSINNSPDISLLLVKVTWDLSGATPTILLENLSQGDNLANVEYAFTAIAPTTTYIHEGDINDPDVSGVWTDHTLGDAWPRPFNNIEFGVYKFYVTAKDSNGNEYTAPVQSVNICRPNGNLPTSTNAFGLGTVSVQTKCEQARIWFQDVTNTSYQGLTGTVGSSVLRVNFPMDNTGTVPDPFQINYFSSAMVPITYSGNGYQFLYTSIYDYDFGDEIHVRIKYLKNDTFGVWCNIDLMPLICEYQKLINDIESGKCADSNSANQKLMLINPKFSLVVMGIFQPLLGIDVPALIEEIKEIGGFDCNCCNVASGVTPPGSSAFDGYTFSVVSLGGDIAGDVVPNGYNIQIQLSDVSYIFKICDSSPAESEAFHITPTVSGDGYTKTYCLSVDLALLAEELLTTISTDAGLVNLFNSIVINSGGSGNQMLLVDGKCIFNSSASCDFEFTLEDIPVDTTFALLTAIKVNTSDASVPLSFAFNLTNLPALQTYLNGLGYGTFTVTNPSGQIVLITSVNNTFGITALGYSIAGDNFLASISSDCTGYTPLTANQVVQNIINYICDLDDSQIVTSAAYEICYIDENGVEQTETIDADTSLTEFLTALTERGCTTIQYILSLSSLNCDNIKALFPEVTTSIIQADDVILGTKEGNCAGIYPTELFLALLTYGPYNQDVLNAFCDMIQLCSAGQACEPYNVLYAELSSGSPDYELTVTFEHPSAVSNTIRYGRIDNTDAPVYTTITGVLPGESPYIITGLENGQYRVYIRPIYADGRVCPEQSVVTLVCPKATALSAIYNDPNIEVTYTVPEGISFLKINISYPNGGFASTIHDISGASSDTILISPPTNVYGTYFVTIQSVCDNDTGFFSAQTAPSAFEIEEPSP